MQRSAAWKKSFAWDEGYLHCTLLTGIIINTNTQSQTYSHGPNIAFKQGQGLILSMF